MFSLIKRRAEGQGEGPHTVWFDEIGRRLAENKPAWIPINHRPAQRAALAVVCASVSGAEVLRCERQRARTTAA